MKKISSFRLILGSNSPRRKELLELMGFDFLVRPSHADESFPENTDPHKVPCLLSERKALSFELEEDELVLTADTVVICENNILNKPETPEEAYEMLSSLSGKTHEVVTGFTLRCNHKTVSISDVAKVTFRELTEEEINQYIESGGPFDKAGGYGIQEWIGLIAISKLEGSFYTVMGLPTHLVYEALVVVSC